VDANLSFADFLGQFGQGRDLDSEGDSLQRAYQANIGQDELGRPVTGSQYYNTDTGANMFQNAAGEWRMRTDSVPMENDVWREFGFSQKDAAYDPEYGYNVPTLLAQHVGNRFNNYGFLDSWPIVAMLAMMAAGAGGAALGAGAGGAAAAGTEAAVAGGVGAGAAGGLGAIEGASLAGAGGGFGAGTGGLATTITGLPSTLSTTLPAFTGSGFAGLGAGTGLEALTVGTLGLPGAAGGLPSTLSSTLPAFTGAGGVGGSLFSPQTVTALQSLGYPASTIGAAGGAGAMSGMGLTAGGAGGASPGLFQQGMDLYRQVQPYSSLASGVKGLLDAQAMKKQAAAAIAGSDPFGASGNRAAANAQLSNLLADPVGAAQNDPAYKLRIQAAMRAAAPMGQKSGAMAIGAANASSNWYDQRLAQLGGLGGAGFNPATGYQTALTGSQAANNLSSQALGSIGFGLNAIPASMWQSMFSSFGG
jgi:hypothetical protein